MANRAKTPRVKTATRTTKNRARATLQVSAKLNRRWLTSNILLEQFGLSDREVEAAQAFASKSPKDKVPEARRIILDTIVNAIDLPDARCALAITESESLLKGYATLDDPHRSEIAKLIRQISAYLQDDSRKRPFNALMLAAPGAGKSHFIKQLAAEMKDERVQAVTFNMATMQSPDDMAQPVDELRNLKVNDRFPLLFLDEFDSDPSRYAALLPLLWDGELHIGHRDLKLGKAVIVLAGSNPDLPKAMDHSAEMRMDADSDGQFVPSGKLVDLLSRINGGIINIPDFDLRTEQRDRRVDKVCVTIGLLKARFGDRVREVPRSLLKFIAHTTFRYGVRSIAHLIDVVDGKAFRDGVLSGAALGLPLTNEVTLQGSSLKLHLLDRDRGFGIVNRWKDCARDKSSIKLYASPLFQFERWPAR